MFSFELTHRAFLSSSIATRLTLLSGVMRHALLQNELQGQAPFGWHSQKLELLDNLHYFAQLFISTLGSIRPRLVLLCSSRR